jgi:hypothetical protein
MDKQVRTSSDTRHGASSLIIDETEIAHIARVIARRRHAFYESRAVIIPPRRFDKPVRPNTCGDRFNAPEVSGAWKVRFVCRINPFGQKEKPPQRELRGFSG